ncbi:MAG: flippase-like domain-containing protein [Candidatus Aminicenantes bacterium]|nr:MAG: flippase-like domain-containing protein [Candidatus Aminicenantes bacterium]
MDKKRALSLLISIVITVTLIWFLLTKIEFKDFVQTFSRIYVPGLLAFMIIALIGATLRAWRYKWLLLPRPSSWRDVFLVTFIRNLFVDLFPARVGSLSYVYVLNKNLKYSFESASSSFVVAFILDFLTLSPFLAFAIVAVGLGKTSISNGILLAISCAFFLLVFFVFWKVEKIAGIALKVYQKFLSVIKQEKKTWAGVSVHKWQLTIDELNKIKERRIGLPLFALSLGIRLAKYSALYFLLYALLRSHGFSLESLSFSKTILGITGAELTSALPIKGIGGFGTWESAWALTLMLMDFEKRIAILSSGIHLITNLFEYALGMGSILFLTLFLSQKKRDTKG